MKLNLDMAKKRLDYHLNMENRKSQNVLKHLSLPKNVKSLGSTEPKTRSKEEKRTPCYSGLMKPANLFIGTHRY